MMTLRDAIGMTAAAFMNAGRIQAAAITTAGIKILAIAEMFLAALWGLLRGYVLPSEVVAEAGEHVQPQLPARQRDNPLRLHVWILPEIVR